jgi:hypothetical protein
LAPKTPSELKEQTERENEKPTLDDGKERSAEGKPMRTPDRSEFFGNLEKVTKPDE